MGKENIYKSFEVFYDKVDHCPLIDKEYNFFELVYVISGKGTYSLNDNLLAFKPADLFLFTPKDTHSFYLDGLCEFVVIHFNKSYIEEFQWKTIDHIECILYHASHLSDSILIDSGDKNIVDLLMKNIQDILVDNRLYQEDLLRHIVNAILVVVARNISMLQPVDIASNADSKVLDIINYIQSNIASPQKLRVAELSDTFGIAPTYLGAYFQKHSGESIQHYVSKYRLRLIEHRLQFSDMRIVEIAEEFGFADPSHLNKFFKRHRGMTLYAFRKNISEKKRLSAEVSA